MNIFQAVRRYPSGNGKFGEGRRGYGFALVLSLVLMSFLLILALSLSTLIQVEVSIASATQSKQIAQQNALFALQEALGTLQETAGPDQRVTTRADIVAPLDGVEGGEITYKEVNNPYYTLVWDVSGAENQEPGEEPGYNLSLKPAVLVSGNNRLNHDFRKDTNYPSGYITGESTLNPADSIIVYNRRGNASHQVRAPLVDLGDRKGKYAWWVGDEGVKARLNLDEDYDSTNAEVAWLSPRRYGVQVSSYLEDAEFSELRRLLSNSQLAFASGTGLGMNPETINGLMLDCTLHSRSLLTDVRNGGLKKDLTYGLTAGNPQPAEIADNVYLIPRDLGGAPGERSYNLNFVQWGILRNFYNLRASGTMVSRANRTASGPNVANYDMGIRPVVVSFQFGIYGDYDTDGYIRFHYMPVLVLWNPYNVDIQIPDLHLIFKEHRNDNEVEIRQINVLNDPEVQNAMFSMKSMPFSIKSTRIPSGKAVIFTPPASEPGTVNAFTPSTGGYGNYVQGSARNWLYPGYRPGASYVQRSTIRKSLDGNQPLQFSLRMDRPLYLDLHEPRSDGIHKDVSRMYQLITGMSPNTKLGSVTVQYYLPEEGDYPAPKFLYALAMPFAGKDYFDYSFVPRQWVGMFNPRAAVNTMDKVNVGYEGLGNYVGGFLADSDAEANYQVQTLDGTYAMLGTRPLWGAERAVLFEIPQAPLISLAQFAHADLLAPPSSVNAETSGSGIVDGDGKFPDESLEALRLSFTGTGDDFSPAYTVGTGRASPHIDLEGAGNDTTRYWRVFNKNTTDARMVWDFPYLVNEVLFDRYYFSTIPQSGSIAEPLRNPLLKIEGDPRQLENELRSFEKAAAHLSVLGGFNVNSTSVEAWSSVLAAMRNQDYDGESGVGTLYTRFARRQGGEVGKGEQSAYSPETVTGYRRLSDAEIRDLAERIVEQVKLRGPFPSMAAFVNRVMWEDTLYRSAGELSEKAPDRHSLYGNNYTMEEMVMRKSALEAALELSDANANYFASGEKIDNSVASGLLGSTNDNRGFRGAVGLDTPGYLSQVDILSTLAPVMTVRSDTFLIRAYGADVNPLTGETRGEAWCEAVVQRLPEYVNADENESSDSLSELSETNRRLGRAFRIVAFRWLNPEEV